MKKRICAFLAILMAFSLVLTACGGSSAPSADPASPASTPSGSGPSPAAPAPTPDNTVYEFKLQNHDAPTGPNSKFLDDWAAAILEASGGRIKINNYHGGAMGGAMDTYYMVKDGVADIGWGFAPFFPGLFPATDAIALPFMGIKSVKQGSYALWELYDTTDYLKDEWKDVKMIALVTNCDAPLITKNKLEKAEDLRGMNMRISGGPPSDWAKLAGANPMNVVLGEIYTAMEKGVISGIASAGWDVINSFKFYEQGKYLLDFSLHVNPCFLIMNQNSYNKLPDDLKAIMDEFCGYGTLEIMGDTRDQEKAIVIEALKGIGGELYQLPAEEQAKLEEFGAQVHESWITSAKEKGIDAEALVAKTLELAAKHAGK